MLVKVGRAVETNMTDSQILRQTMMLLLVLH